MSSLSAENPRSDNNLHSETTPGVLPHFSASELRVDVDKLVNELIEKSVAKLKTNDTSREEAAYTLASFGTELLPHIFKLVDHPTPQETTPVYQKFIKDVRSARESGVELPKEPEILLITPLKIENLREYLTLVGRGADIFKPLIEKAMILDDRSSSPSDDMSQAQHFASWARAYANASDGGKDILPELRNIRELADKDGWRSGGCDANSAANFMDTLIEEIEAGEIHPVIDFMSIGQS